MAEKEVVKTEKRMANPGDVVELLVGEQWVDDLSGISLYRGFYRLANRNEMKLDKRVRETGYIREDERKPTAVLPENVDLSRVEKALRLGILKKFDPKNPSIYKERTNINSRRVNDAETDAGSRYSNETDDKISLLLKMKYQDFLANIKTYKSIAMLEKIYDAECEGRNPTAGPRKGYVDALKTRMKDSDVGGVSAIKSKPSEYIKIE
jgi:hypothetical protein